MSASPEAIFDVFCPGYLDVLSIGRGDLRLMVGDNDEDREQAKALIEEMLRKGYSIFVETDDGPVKVHEFNPHRMSYIIQDAPAGTEQSADQPTPITAKKTRHRREVPVAGSQATAVGRTAGG